jgi:hypothetical protein
MEWYWRGESEVLREKHYTALVVAEWMGMERWWNDTDRGKSEVLREKHYTALVVAEWMGMERWWNDTDRGKSKYCYKILSQWHFTHHKSHMEVLTGRFPAPIKVRPWQFHDGT